MPDVCKLQASFKTCVWYSFKKLEFAEQSTYGVPKMLLVLVYEDFNTSAVRSRIKCSDGGSVLTFGKGNKELPYQPLLLGCANKDGHQIFAL